jgi:hypothetical protein
MEALNYVLGNRMSNERIADPKDPMNYSEHASGIVGWNGEKMTSSPN